MFSSHECTLTLCNASSQKTSHVNLANCNAERKKGLLHSQTVRAKTKTLVEQRGPGHGQSSDTKPPPIKFLGQCLHSVLAPRHQI